MTTLEDPTGLLALIYRYADLREAAPAESEHGSALTADRLEAHAVTIEAEIRARLGLSLPSPNDPPRDLLNVSVLVDSTSGCPVADQCSDCGAAAGTAYLSAVVTTSAVGTYCTTLCWDCEQHGRVPAVDSLDAAYALALWHAGHMGIELPHLNDRHPGCPKCTRIHHPWCPPYGGPGYATTETREESTASDHPTQGSSTDTSASDQRTTEHDGLRWHLFTRHANIAALGMSDTAALDDHAHEHRGPGTIRNHDPEDLTYDPQRAAAMLDEGTASGVDFTAAGPPHPVAAARAQAAAEQLPTVGRWT